MLATAVRRQRDRQRGPLRQLARRRLRATGPGADLGELALQHPDHDIVGEIALEERIRRRDGDPASADATDIARPVIAAAL